MENCESIQGERGPFWGQLSEGGRGRVNFSLKCKHHKYHHKIILHTKFYLNQTIEKFSKPVVNLGGRGAEFRRVKFRI